MSNLLLHRGSHEVTRQDLQAVPTPPATRTWTPIPHLDLLETVRRELLASGLDIEEESLALSHSFSGSYGDRFFGLLQVRNGHESHEYKIIAGIRNSHDKRLPAGLCVGSRVLVCDNLSFSSEVVLSRKHTSRIRADLPRLINQAVGRLGDLRVQQHRRIEAYQATELADPQFHDLAVRAVDGGVIAASKLPRVLKDYREPEHEAFEPRTVWSAFNAFTEHLKSYDLHDLPRRTQVLHGLCDLVARVCAT